MLITSSTLTPTPSPHRITTGIFYYIYLIVQLSMTYDVSHIHPETQLLLSEFHTLDYLAYDVTIIYKLVQYLTYVQYKEQSSR